MHHSQTQCAIGLLRESLQAASYSNGVNLLHDIQKAQRLAQRVIERRRAYASYRRSQRANQGQPTPRFEIGVYFSDSHVNAYQMRQWYEPLRELNKQWPVVIIARNVEGAELLVRESGLHVRFAPKVKHLEQLVAKHPLKLVLYVNQNTKNFQMLRYGDRWHVFINHGESDKMYMTTNQIKAYDYAFIAGGAAHDRLTKHVWNYDVSHRTFQIGRPQTDFMTGEAPFPDDDRITVLYAPTWEGDRPSAAYGSIHSHGEAIVQAVLSSPNHRLVYRPHPRTGVEDEGYRSAHRRILKAIAQANMNDPQAHHVHDSSAAINWQLTQTDVAICDISAMIYDRLAVGKPVLVTKPAHPAARVDTLGYLQACEWLTEADASRILEEIDRVLHDESTREKLAFWAQHYFGDITQGAPMSRLTQAVDTLMQRWESTQSEMEQRRAGER